MKALTSYREAAKPFLKLAQFLEIGIKVGFGTFFAERTP
jgi:hypothetical protein